MGDTRYKLANSDGNNGVVSAFKSWIPGNDEVICAKPGAYYESHCFNKKVGAVQKRVKNFRKDKKLQGDGAKYQDLTVQRGAMKKKGCYSHVLGPDEGAWGLPQVVQ